MVVLGAGMAGFSPIAADGRYLSDDEAARGEHVATSAPSRPRLRYPPGTLERTRRVPPSFRVTC